MEPTEEQAFAVELFDAGLSLALEAGAGTGKTSTLKLMAESTRRRGQYVAFNKAIVTDAAATMPRNVAANTAHSLAFRAIGRRYAHRLNSKRMRSSDLARALKVDPVTVTVGTERKTLSAGFLASTVMKAIGTFCQSADPAPDVHHVGYIEGIDPPDATQPGGARRTWANNTEVATYLLPAMARAWTDLCDPAGVLPYTHAHYLKWWERNNPRIGADFVLLDEAQDVSPVMLSIVTQQSQAQLVFVGDSQQEIYAWMGAVNAMESVPHDARAFLTRSFRFGAPIADVANMLLELAGAEIRLTGDPSIDSEVRGVMNPAAILTRTNACAVSTMLDQQRKGHQPHLVGGGTEVAAFARAAGELQAGTTTEYHDLACFSSWGEVQAYVDQDPQGAELKLLVGLVDEYSVPVILAALDTMPPEDRAGVIVSTAHKAKGREWPAVQLAGDFPDPDARPEIRLLYVAATRARAILDIEGCGPIYDLIHPPAPPLDLGDAAFIEGLAGR